MLGFVLVTADSGKAEQVYQILRKVPEIKELDYVFSAEYDMLAKIEAPDFKGFSKVVAERIQHLEDVLRISVLPAADI